MIADVRAQVALSIFTDWEHFAVFAPSPLHEKSLAAMLDQVVAWRGAPKPLRGWGTLPHRPLLESE